MMGLLTTRSFEEVKQDAKVFFGVQVVMLDGEMRALWEKNGKLADTLLVQETDGMSADSLRDNLVLWLGDEVDEKSFAVFRWVRKKLEGTRWSLELSSYRYFAVLKYDFSGCEREKAVYGERLYEIPVTPRAVLDLCDFLENEAHREVPLHVGEYETFFPIASE